MSLYASCMHACDLLQMTVWEQLQNAQKQNCAVTSDLVAVCLQHICAFGRVHASVLTLPGCCAVILPLARCALFVLRHLSKTAALQ